MNGAGGSAGIAQGFHELSEVLPSEFMGISPAGEVGIGGFYLLPAAMKFHHAQPFDGTLMDPDPDVPNFEPAEPDDEFLKDWDEADFERLHLTGPELSIERKERAKKSKIKGRLPSNG